MAKVHLIFVNQSYLTAAAFYVIEILPRLWTIVPLTFSLVDLQIPFQVNFKKKTTYMVWCLYSYLIHESNQYIIF